MDLQGLMVWAMPFFTIGNIVITWINSKSKKDVASATEMAELKNELKNKVDAVLFAQVVGKIDTLTDMTKQMISNMKSVLNDSNTNATQIEVSQTKIVAIEARLKKIENKIESKTENDWK